MRSAFLTLAIAVLLIVSTPAQQQAARSIAVTRVNVIDATGGPIKRDMTVVIDDGKIIFAFHGRRRPGARARRTRCGCMRRS